MSKLLNKLLAEIKKLRLEHLDDEWVQAIIQSEFLEFGDLPTEYKKNIETIDISALFKNVMNATVTWLNSATPSEDKSWFILCLYFNHEKILAILAYYIDLGCKNFHTKTHRNIALIASRVYYTFLSIPGYKAYLIYHSQLFINSLACLSFPKVMSDNASKNCTNKELIREVNYVVKELICSAKDLLRIVACLQLNPQDIIYEEIVDKIIDITDYDILNKLQIDTIELSNLCKVIYEIIHELVHDAKTGVNSVAIKLLFKCLLPKFIQVSTHTRNGNNLVKASIVVYTIILLKRYGKGALEGYTLLLQHICYSVDGLERQEVRNGRVTLLLGLMAELPRHSHRKTVKWIMQMSTTSRALHRHITVDLLGKLLNNPPEDPVQQILASPRNEPAAAPDASDSGIETIQNTSESRPETPKVEEDVTTRQQSVATEEDGSQVPSLELDDEMEDFQAGLACQLPHPVKHAEILRAVHARLNDVSSGVRARALVVLTDCVGSTRLAIVQAIKELTDSGEMNLRLVAARSVCDERAAVRRAGALLVQGLLSAPCLPPEPTDLEILVSLCRDASILVRSTAITALSDLAMCQPSEAMLDAFLVGPMHQLSDPENKVQEQVVTHIHLILIDRLKVFTGPDCKDLVPWMFLAGITRRHMRRHLQKACSLMAEAKRINHCIIDILSTHLGVMGDERDLQCLVLLTCLAGTLEYSNVGFAIDYYYKLANSEQVRDTRLMSLILELLMTWSINMQPIEKTTLKEHLVRSLLAAKDDGCRIAIAALAARLDPKSLNWSTEIMQLAEQRAIADGDIEEAIRAADLSLLAPEAPNDQLFEIFLTALEHPSPGWSAALRSASVAGAGRLCVRSHCFAVAAAPRMAALLADQRAPLQARVNSLLALTDVCVRYAAIVDKLLDPLCDCLSRESPPELRQTTARSLTKLLLRDFLRLRTPLYQRYFSLLADDDHAVREPAEYYVTSVLDSTTILNNFVESVIYYNKETTEKISFDSRQSIYDVMLQRLSIVQKLNVQCRLAREVLQHAAQLTDEGCEELPPELNAALLDTITLLCSPRMKLPGKPPSTGDPTDMENLQERVTSNIVSHKMKHTVAKILVPAVLRLYGNLGPRGGQVATYLVRIITTLLDDYRHELEELIEKEEEIVERIQKFQENIGQPSWFRSSRNLVTTSAPPEPDTPHAPRTPRPRAADGREPRRRALNM